MLIANSNLVPDWASWPEFRRLEALGLTMYGQMTAGSWIYIGTQGILQGTYETFAALAAQRYGGTLRGRLVVTAGLGGMGGAQPLAVTMNDGVALVVECDPARLRRRLDGRYLDRGADSLDEAVRICEAARAAGEPLSVGVIGNAAEVLPELLRRGVEVDVVTDQTSAHDPLSYLPRGVDVADWGDYAAAKPDEFTDRSRESMAEHVEAMVGFADRGAEVFDYGNSLRAEAKLGGYERAFDYPGFVPAYIRPLFCAGKGPFRWAALSGDPADIAATDAAVLDLFPDNEPAGPVDPAGRGAGAAPGPAGPDLLAGHGRAGPGRAAVQRDGGRRPGVGADRDRPRPPGLRLGGLAVPGDRGDGRRLGRDRRLAAAERAGGHLVGGVMGVAAPRRRGGHRTVHPRRAGQRGRRHRAGRAEAGPGAHQRPGHGRPPPRRRGLPGGDRGRRGRRPAHPHARTSSGSAPMTSDADDVRGLDAIADVGRDPVRGGYSRHGYDAAELTLREWFAEAAGRAGLEPETDGNGNIWAWWDGRRGPDAVVTGSHLDSVPGGGAFDGPLGVLGALAAVRRLRADGFTPQRPLAVAVFVEEEGGRFGLPCLGSRLLTGALPAADALRRTDRDGVPLADAMRAAGHDPERVGPDPERLAGIGAFVELHVEQGTLLAPTGATLGVATGILAHGRWRLRFTGQGNHAGTTAMDQRRDPMLAAAATVLAVREIAGARGSRATVGRLQPIPGGTNVIASVVDLWLDVRDDILDRARSTVAEIATAAQRLAGGQGCTVAVAEESVNGQVTFPAGLRAELAAALGDVPQVPTGAGHDAGVLAEHVPAGMIFVRNPTGISHAPEEHAEPDDCAAGVRALAGALRGLAGG